MAGKVGSDLAVRDEQLRGRSVTHHEVGERHGGVRDVAPSHVERPCDRIERGDDDGVVSVLFQRVGNRLAFVGARSPGKGIVMRHGHRIASLRLIGPDRIDRVAVGGDQFDALRRQRFRRGFSPFDPVEPCIVTDPCTAWGIGGDPLDGRGRRHVLVIVEIGGNLLAHLHGVAPVGEHRRLVAQDHRAARAAAEAGQPLQALGIIADILAHMLVADRHDEAVQPPFVELSTQAVEAGFGGVHQHDRILRRIGLQARVSRRKSLAIS